MAKKQRWSLGGALPAISAIVAACGGQSSAPSSSTPMASAQSPIPTITIKAIDFSFDQPKTIPAGLVDLILVNNGTQPHNMQLLCINDGNYDEFVAALKRNGPDASTLRLITGAGGTNIIDPGGKQEVILKLTPGEYAAICFASGSDNVPHYMKGMIQHLTVTGSPPPNQPEPQASTVVTLKDFSIDVPSNVTGGAVIWKVTNDGPQLHEMSIIKLHSSVTFEQFRKILFSPNPPSGPPLFDDAGGIAALQPGTSGWMKLNLQSGNYVALDPIPDLKTGKRNFMLGMISPFTVA